MSDDDEFDWDALDKELEKSQVAAPSVKVDKRQADYDRLKENYNLLERKLLEAHGESSILRSNLDKLQTSRRIEKDAMQQNETSIEKRHQTEVEEMRREIEKLKSERQFMMMDQQQSMLDSKIRSKRKKPEQDSPVVTPNTSPKKAGPPLGRDLGADFRDGFVVSPKRKRVGASDSTAATTPAPVVISVENQQSKETTPGYQQQLQLLESSRMMTYRRMIRQHRAPRRDRYAVEELMQRYNCRETIEFNRALDSEDIVLVAKKACQLVDCSAEASLLVLPLLQITVEVDSRVLSRSVETIVHSLTRLITLNLSNSKLVCCALDVLLSVCACCYFDSDLFDQCWQVISPTFIESILDPSTLDPEALTKSVSIISASIAPHNIGSRHPTANNQLARIYDLMNCIFSIQNEQLLQCQLLRLNNLLYTHNHFGDKKRVSRLVELVVECTSSQLDKLYQDRRHQHCTTNLAQLCVQTLYATQLLYPYKLALSSRILRLRHVVLSQISLGELEDELNSFDQATIDRATELLEQLLTQSEIEQVSEIYEI